MIKCKYGFIILIVASVFYGCKNSGQEQIPQKLTDDQQRLSVNAIKGLKIDDGLYATLFASEPMITNPTNMDIDSKGRVWICEGYNYRPTRNPGNPVDSGGDRILILEDIDGDGIADTSKVFYQGTDVNAALGICVLGNKVIVSCSPKVFVFTDTDGDDKADKKEILFEGIAGEQHDHGIHAFTFGPDGKLYFNFGNAGDSLLDKNGNAVKDPDGFAINNHGKPYRQGMVFRCDLDGSHVEVLGNNFRNPYEVAVDAFGNLWQSDNDDDGNKGVRINYVMKYGNYGYTDEMTGANWKTPRVNMEDSIPYRHWHLNDPGVVPNLLQTGAGSPTGMVVYEGNLLPTIFRNQIIHADALPNVVRSYAIEKDGAGYKAKITNIVEGIYDNWFRPSDVCVAPDGSLFISDWYDPGVGGHQVGDLNRGRIFRIAPPGSKYFTPPLDLNTPDGAANALENPNLATRYLAWMKLYDWGDKGVPVLRKMYNSNNPRFKARALWLLSKRPNGLQFLRDGIKDNNPDIRITAIRAAKELPIDIIPLIRMVVNDPSPQVRRAAIIALHHNQSPDAPSLWAGLAEQYDGQDRWYLEALGIGADSQWDRFLPVWLKSISNSLNTPNRRDIIWRSRSNLSLPLLSQIIEDKSVDPEKNLKFFRAFDFIPDGNEKQNILLGMLNGGHSKQGFINAVLLLQVDIKGNLGKNSLVKKKLEQSLESVKNRPEFIQLVSKYQVVGKLNDLLEIVLYSSSDELKSQALTTLLNLGGEKIIKNEILKNSTNAEKVIEVLGKNESSNSKDILRAIMLDKGINLELRKKATLSFGKGWDGENRLLKLIEAQMLPSELDSSASSLLLVASRESVRKQAQDYFNINQNKNPALLPIREFVKLNGNSVEGRKVFNNYCSSCHIVKNEGVDFGPNLSEIGSKLAKDAIYKSIITPDAGISFGYEGYLFKLKDGTELLGYISSETKDKIDIRVVGGGLESVNVKDLISRKKYDHSLMPTGLAENMSQDELVNLVEYLSMLKRK